MAVSLVVVVRGTGVLGSDGSVRPAALAAMYERGLARLTGQPGAAAGLASIFSPSARVGIKINGIAGRRLTSPPEVTLPLAGLLVQAGLKERAVTIWDRSNRELREAGYRLNNTGSEFCVYGTDTVGAGYGPEPLEHRSTAGRFSSILTDAITASISFAVLKDHGLAGLTAGMKNYFGAVHNPNKYHDDGCDPYVADLFHAPPIRAKHRLTILDALTVQYHKGPSFHARWAERRETLVFGLDPVAVDTVGLDLVAGLRKAKGLPTLAEEGRPVRYLATAKKLGLGAAAPASIRVIEEAA